MKNKYMYIKEILLLTVLLILLQSCEKFLEEAPSKTSSLVVKTTAQINALLNNQSSFYLEGNRTQIYSSDDFGLTT